MNTQNQIQNQEITTNLSRRPLFTGALAHHDLLEDVPSPNVRPAAPMASVPQTKTDHAPSWLAAMILVIGLGSLTLQQQQVRPLTAPTTLPRASSPVDVKKIAPLASSKRTLKMGDVKMQLGRIMKRADSINTQARLASIN